ncbi:MAG TPA: glycine cleavage system protein GcvH [Thermoplasmata archaeon]|jgi:glycine cleavage system H protein|nr:glycine cleavage system protein GcvH [Thermoplasmata archaeon]
METSKAPDDRKYTKSHEWVQLDGDRATVGITDHAQGELTDIVFVDLPAPGKSYAAGASVLVLESVKTVADVYAPGEGTLEAANPDLKSHPEYINQDPYGKGWVFRLRLTQPIDPATLLDAAGYLAFVAGGG